VIGELESRQIAAWLSGGCSPEDIARELGVDIALVKLVGAKNELVADRDISDEELGILRKHAFALAVSAESQEVQAKMTTFLLERDRPSKKEAAVNIITQINQGLASANAKYDEMIKLYNVPTEAT
jgi:hypothetical protein